MTSGLKNTVLKPTIPTLENGDRLTRIEFENRYTKSNIKKAELIDGIVYMASPLRITKHGNPHARIMTWLGIYWSETPGIELGDNSTVRLDGDNEPQPNALLRIENGGKSIISEDGYVEGAPELIVEIAASTVSIDVHEKKKIYRRNQVQEYLVWRVEDGEIDWYSLQKGEYVQLQPNSEGIICSEVFPGLWLDKTALLTGNLIKVIEVVQLGLATAEHQNFVEKLSKEGVGSR
ncbi:MAG: Uma2 family endonuclease [Okeania sp. SIO3B5]|uniref:Uma2 family endonuclease n=1 Tax=Okeania sp. SIO3B5 TaxID=2607811 RepID=UPI0013FFAF96|nr:Uma2 family endonuclease [Okeania sp. SIO3B5]NEO54566.1 Uma2 family endonuclease [Okeania sp. SIO3B5]